MMFVYVITLVILGGPGEVERRIESVYFCEDAAIEEAMQVYAAKVREYYPLIRYTERPHDHLWRARGYGKDAGLRKIEVEIHVTPARSGVPIVSGSPGG